MKIDVWDLIYQLSPFFFAWVCLWSIHQRKRLPAVTAFVVYLIHAWALLHRTPVAQENVNMAHALLAGSLMFVLYAAIVWLSLIHI